MRRLRWAVILVGVLVAVLAAAGWVWSMFRLEHVAFKHGWGQGPDAAPDPSDPATSMWRYHAVTFTGQVFRGTVTLTRSEYLSLGARAEDMDGWKTWNGWERHSVPINTVRGFPNPGSFFRGPLDWRVLGTGIYRASSRGEESGVVDLPCWVIIIGAAVPAGLAWRVERRIAGRRQRGECPRCGYPLPAGATACPECGAAGQGVPRRVG